MDSKDIKIALNLAKELAKNAGLTLLEADLDLRKHHFEPENIKEVKSLADEVLDHTIIMGLKPTKIPILTEESGLILDQSDTDLLWIVDPLDGTFNFIKGLGSCAISIALWENDQPVLGVIYDIQGKSIYWGGDKIGAFSGDKRIRVSNTYKKNEASICTGFPARMEMDSDMAILDYWKQIKTFSKIRMFGSAAISLLNVAKGSADAYMEKNIMVWDVAAGLAIVEGAGGFCVYKKGTIPYSLDVRAANNESILNL
jgi:myo-inositol-1(or 4)-monophosphatase